MSIKEFHPLQGWEYQAPNLEVRNIRLLKWSTYWDWKLKPEALAAAVESKQYLQQSLQINSPRR